MRIFTTQFHGVRWLAGLSLALWVGCSTTSQEGVLRGKVVGITDGDGITLLDADKETHKIRLMGIDAPERRQAFGNRARQQLSELVFDKEIEVHWEKTDFYKRILGKLMVQDPDCQQKRCPLIDANLRMVETGYAWWYKQYQREQSPADRELYEAAELASREAKLGLWVDPDPTPPWEWRKQDKERRRQAKAERETKAAQKKAEQEAAAKEEEAPEEAGAAAGKVGAKREAGGSAEGVAAP